MSNILLMQSYVCFSKIKAKISTKEVQKSEIKT